MTETSYYWNGLITGDASLAPAADSVFHGIWKKMFTQTDDEGILLDYENILLVAGISGGVTVASGAALVNGWFYENTSEITVVIPTPTTNPRIDRIVAQFSAAAQTVRIALVAGTESATPSAPALTQSAGGIWEIPLANVLITTAGVITVTNNSDNARTNLQPQAAIELIETIIADGTTVYFDFLNIPQIYKHLRIIGMIRHTNTSVNAREDSGMRWNNDSGTNYHQISINANDVTVGAGPNISQSRFFIGAMPDTTSLANRPAIFEINIPNYRQTTFFKTATYKSEGFMLNATLIGPNYLNGFIWDDVSAINQISIFNIVEPTPVVAGSEVTLYGLK